MIHGLEKKTLTWKFLESIEAPRVMHIRTTSLLSDDNVYGQVTVRFYTKQVTPYTAKLMLRRLYMRVL